MRCLWVGIFVIFFTKTGFVQEMFKYDGSFQNGLIHPGEANFSYYVDDENKHKIMDGSFKYRVRISNDQFRFYQDIKGKYVKGSKDGSWQYKTSFKDYNRDLDTEYLTGNMSLTARYHDGVPHGDWIYSYSYKTRERLDVENGRIKWSSYSANIIQHLRMRFNNGMLLDTLSIRTGDGQEFIGMFDKNGMVDGEWRISDNEKITHLLYERGVLHKKVIIQEENGDKEEFLYFTDQVASQYNNINTYLKENKSLLKDLKYTTDTFSLLKDPLHFLSTYIRDYIFDNKYFLFNYIEGDKLEYGDLRGAYQVQIVNQVSRQEKIKLDTLHGIYDAFTRVNVEINKLSSTKRFSPQQQSLVKIVRYYVRIAERYKCISENLLTKMNFESGSAKASEKCDKIVTIIEGIPRFTCREEALDYFIKDLREKLSVSRSYLSIICR